MCLPEFIEFRDVPENEPLIGYRNWKLPINGGRLFSINMDYIWRKKVEGPHLVEDSDSGIYSYNNYNNNNYNYYYYYYTYSNYNNYNYKYNNYHNYRISGIINQYGKVAIHKSGYRSEFAKIKTLFLIRTDDANGKDEFLQWIKLFNQQIKDLAKFYEADTIFYQDFLEQLKLEQLGK